MTDGETNEEAVARAALADIIDDVTPDYSNAWFDKIDESDRRTVLRAETALQDIGERLAASRSKVLGLLRELLKPDVWRVLMASRELKKVMKKVDPHLDFDRKEHSVFALVLSGDGVEDIEIIDFHEDLDDLCDTLYRVASAAHISRGEDFATVSGIDQGDAEQRRSAAIRWAVDAGAGAWLIRKIVFFENTSGTRGREYSTILIDADFAMERGVEPDPATTPSP